MQHRSVIVYGEAEYYYGKNRNYYDEARADTVLVKLEGADYLYRVVKTRHTGNVGRVVRMEVL